MSKLTHEIKEFAAQQRLGFLATICQDGTPNLSPKGLTFVYDEQTIIIGEVRSPATIENLVVNPIAELNIVDRNKRRGFRFKGHCEIYESGEDFDRYVAFLHTQGAQSRINAIILMRVDRVQPLISPAYGDGMSEAELETRWKRHYDEGDATNLGE